MEFLEKKYQYFILALSFGIIFGCSINQKTLTLDNSNFSVNSLSLNGYFYKVDNYGMIGVFLYDNGIYLYIGGEVDCFSHICFESYVEKFTNRNVDQNIYDLKEHWGKYKIEGENIIIERFRGIGWASYRIQKLEGRIKNKNQYIIHTYDDKKLDENWEFNFHPYSPKPDSTSKFIDYR